MQYSCFSVDIDNPQAYTVCYVTAAILRFSFLRLRGVFYLVIYILLPCNLILVRLSGFAPLKPFRSAAF